MFDWEGHYSFLMKKYDENMYTQMKRDNYWVMGMLAVRIIAKKICTALKFIHGLNITHCDLKPENVFVSSPNHVVLGDFGAAIIGKSTHPVYHQTRFYRAPEVVLGNVSGKAVDLWSLGVLMIELIDGAPSLRC